VETGHTRVLAADDLAQLGRRVTEWQDGVARDARDLGLDVLRLGGDGPAIHDRLVSFLLARKQAQR